MSKEITYTNCVILFTKRKYNARFIGTDTEGNQREIITPPLITSVELPDSSETVVLHTEGDTYVCRCRREVK